MKVLVCGAHGFIGSAICERLRQDGHDVVKGRRGARAPDELAIDYGTDCDAQHWVQRLSGIDAVVNAVGIIVESGEQTFERLHHRAPVALFAACRETGVRRIVQISALGADSGTSAYFASKRAADRYALDGPVSCAVIRPSLVFGASGISARLFCALASLPVLCLPGKGDQRLRPVHIDDLSELVSRMLGANDNRCIDFVGATQTTYHGMLASYRASMGLPRTLSIGIPALAMRAVAAVGDFIPGASLTTDTWRMLQAGSTACVDETARELGRMPRAIEAFIAPDERDDIRRDALSVWRTPLLRMALALVWLGTAFVSAFVYPHAASFDLLARLKLHGPLADVALYGACTVDFVLGVATLLRPSRKLWLTQIALILAYTAAISISLPEFLAQPFGPILKNIPIITILLVLLGEEVKS